jgi:hypothetical protein
MCFSAANPGAVGAHFDRRIPTYSAASVRNCELQRQVRCLASPLYPL